VARQNHLHPPSMAAIRQTANDPGHLGADSAPGHPLESTWLRIPLSVCARGRVRPDWTGRSKPSTTRPGDAGRRGQTIELGRSYPPEQYDRFSPPWARGGDQAVPPPLALEAFRHTAAYDAAPSWLLESQRPSAAAPPLQLQFAGPANPALRQNPTRAPSGNSAPGRLAGASAPSCKAMDSAQQLLDPRACPGHRAVSFGYACRCSGIHRRGVGEANTNPCGCDRR